MEEIESTVQTTSEATADQQDAFLDGFGADEPETDTSADQQFEAEEGEAQTEVADEATEESEEAESEKPEGEQAETPAAAAEEKPAEQPNSAPTSWTIKHMGESKTISTADITPELLQKGMDYDRIRGKYEESKPVMEMFTEFAKSAGMSVTDYAKFIRTEAKKASGMSEAEAKRTVELEEREAAVAQKEAKQQEGTSSAEARRAEVRADLAEFSKAFPEIYSQAKTNPKVIPESVWKEVREGLSLTAAYSRHVVATATAATKAAQERVEAANKERQNASRSTGSMRSAGRDSKVTDAFLDGFGL